MSAIEHIRQYHDELTAFRQDLHAHPELGMEEYRTAEKVATQLEAWGIEVHRGVGKTGVVGVLRSGNGTGRIGLRADMDALPILEANDVAYKSLTPGAMHACGHDGHTTMLLGAARYLAETRDFNGVVNFIFQPGEEGMGGGLAMLGDRLFERFPCDSVFGLHNWPAMEVGAYAITPGRAMAGCAFFDIRISGKGAHGAQPQDGIDPLLTACHIGAVLQSVISRNVAPSEAAVVSVTKIAAGAAYNVVPDIAVMGGTARAFSTPVLQQIEARMRAVVEGVATSMGATAALDFRTIMTPLVNDPVQAGFYADVAAELVGDAAVDRARAPLMGSEDFAFMLERVPGAYMLVGNGPGFLLHHPRYNFNDEAIPFGAGLYARLVERALPRDVQLSC
jgi:amidohydrolase